MSHYHFIGIGGIGMGTLALLLLDKGEQVSGSDVKDSAMTRNLLQRGAKVFIGHEAQQVAGADHVIYSSAVTAANPEMVEAKQRGIPVRQRAHLLAQLMESQVGITVAGAHGKTTTTSMIATLFLKAGLNPTVAVGGVIRGADYSAYLGEGKYFVAEVDESDGSFLYFHPTYSVITNIDFEHVDYYHTFENIVQAYARFMAGTAPDGVLIIWGGDPRLTGLARASGRRYLTYGLAAGSDLQARNIQEQGGSTKFDCVWKGQRLGAVQLVIPGQHNVLNALAALAVGLDFGLDFSQLAESFLSFQGVNRRFQVKGQVDDIMVVDDYGHHPTEIAATLRTARSLQKKRVITVFQPHRYTRTQFLLEDFVKHLALAENLIITDIYAASETPIEGVTAQALCGRLKAAGHPCVQYVRKEDLVTHLLSQVQSGDMVLTLGAGDITRIGDDFLTVLKQRAVITGEKTS